jgi:hypothetical protein
MQPVEATENRNAVVSPTPRAVLAAPELYRQPLNGDIQPGRTGAQHELVDGPEHPLGEFAESKAGKNIRELLIQLIRWCVT